MLNLDYVLRKAVRTRRTARVTDMRYHARTLTLVVSLPRLTLTSNSDLSSRADLTQDAESAVAAMSPFDEHVAIFWDYGAFRPLGRV